MRAVFIAGAVLLFCVAIGARRCLLSTEQKLASLQEASVRLQETVTPVRFKITARKNGVVSADIRFYDLSGAETGKTAVKLPGSELFVDVAVVRADGGFTFVPYAVFTDEVAQADGIRLTGAPASGDSYGNAVHDIRELSGFTVGAVYAVRCHPFTGGVEITKE